MVLLLAVNALAGTTTIEPGDDPNGFLSSLLPGDVLELADGRYELEYGLDLLVSGTEAQPIVVRAAKGATPVLAVSGSDYTFDIREVEHVRVEGLTLEGPADPPEGFWAGGARVYQSDSVALRGLTVTGYTGSGIRVEGDCRDVTVAGSAVVDMRGGLGIEVGCWDASCWLEGGSIAQNWVGRLTGEYPTGIFLHHGTQDVAVTDNVIADIPFRGLYAGSTEYGEPNRIEGNAIFAIGEHGLVLQGSARVRNNVIMQTAGFGIWTVEDTSRGGLADVVIAYNTLADNGDWGMYLDGWPDAPGMVLSSNVVSNPLSLAVWYPPLSATRFTANRIRANVFTGGVDLSPERWVDGWIEGNGHDDLEDVLNRNVYPARLSILIDAGDGSPEGFVPPIDFNGTVRDGAAPDAGAYSYVSEGNPGWALTDDFKVLGYVEDDRSVDLGAGCCSGGGGSKAWLALGLLPVMLRRRRERR